MTIDATTLKSIFADIATAIAADRDRLCALDGVIGDADHGIAMELGFNAARDAVAALGPEADPTAVLNTAAKAFLNAVGASSGPLYATAFMCFPTRTSSKHSGRWRRVSATGVRRSPAKRR